MSEQLSLYEILFKVQQSVKAPKGQYNSFGKYAYRSAEDIMEAVKPTLKSYKAIITCSDEIVEVGGRNYVKATATISCDREGAISVSAFAREPEVKKGMDEMQITGAASSYARKYALAGLLLLDDNKDADSLQPTVAEPKAIPETDAQRKASGEEFIGFCQKNNLKATAVAKHYGLTGKPKGAQILAALDDLKSMVDLNTIPKDWRMS